MQPDDVKRFAVIGLGKMGVDWVANILEGGYQVVGFDSQAEARNRAAGALDKAAGTSPEMIANKEAQAAAMAQGPSGGPQMQGRKTIPTGMA